MYPANHYMDPYHSHYRNHTLYPYYPPPRWEVHLGPPQVMDSSYRPASYGPWPYNTGMNHPHPSDYHCCCYQTYPPDHYSFRPPFPQELPPPHLYYHGPFPQHSNACPSYFVPPHPYPADQTPYGYDKFKNHCCGCPNHVCHGAEKSNVKIEEERPDVKLENEHKNADRGSIIHHPNNQYPFIWLPSGNMEGEENGKQYELSPQLLNRWPPGSSKRTEHDNQKEKRFQWPIVWMPAGYDEPKQKAKEMEEMQEIPKAPNISGEAPQSPKIKIIPLSSWFENGHHDQKPAANDGSGDHNDRSTMKNQSAITDHQDGITLEGSPKTTSALPKRVNDEKKPVRENYKTIPVVSEKEIDEKKASTCRNIPVMRESDEKKTTSEKKEAKKVEGNGKATAAKHSKLPPVCLRVDPLPRKKSGNGSSRSPSPPTRKEGDKAKKDVKKAQGQNVEPKQPKQSNTRDIAVSEVKDESPDEMKRGMGFANETMQAASAENSREEEVATSKHDQKAQAGNTSIGAQGDAGVVQENAGAESLKGCDERTNEDATVVESESAKDDAQTHIVNLSEPDAAVRIQSVYRGYDVRRWQPLDKLRKIKDVHKQMQDVRRQLQCLEDSCKKLTEKEQVAIGETIMNLLLKLDTIQGLHPTVREARKSVARELICLQEKLDTLCKQPSSGHTDNDGERAENIIQTAAPGVTAEASDREDRAVGLGKAEEPSSVDCVDLCDPLSSVVPLEVRQDADAGEQKDKKEEPCTTKMEKAHEEVQSSMDMMSDAALPEHHTDNQEQQIEETNVVSVKQVTEEEKPAAMGELEEMPSASSTEPLHDAESSGDSSGLKQCPASTEQNLHTRSNTGLSPASTMDINASAAVISVENGVTTEKDGPVDSQVHETTAVKNLELKHDVSSAEDHQQNETSSSVAHLEEDSLVPLKHVEQRDPTPANDLVVSNTEDQQEARDVRMQEQALDTMQDSAKEPDGKLEASTNDSKLDAPADAEKHDQTALVEPTLVSSSASELVLDESEDTMPCGVSSKDEPPHVDDKTKPPTVDKLTEGSANSEDSLCEESTEEPNIQGGHSSLAEEADETRGGTVFPELESCELPCAHHDGIIVDERPEMNGPLEGQTDAPKENCGSDSITVDERPEMKGPLEGQTDALKENGSSDSSGADVVVSETDECTETLKEAAPVCKEGASSTEDADLRVSETDKCNETPKDGPAHAIGANPAEDEANTAKEDLAVQTENKASSGNASPGDLKDSDEKKLAEENQKLKELLQKLLASGNDQMGVITDLSEKVNALERRLARKKRAKVRVHRPSRHAAKVH
ncbi:hypothetical protein U9M48_024915 [Paspalum notatum var. saurae]|uniref:BAG domain-containing protein n=1 Tax=Paspalum notatum var. saurae TaxID=547442 RepID=A0AAQ3TP34_PASNO